MSFTPTAWRPYTRAGWGGKAASHWRGNAAGRGLWRGQVGTVVWRGTLATVNRALVGVAKKSDGSLLAGATIDLFFTATDTLCCSTLSDAAGNFRFDNLVGGPFYLVMYAAGSPDFAGTTVNTLMAA